MEVLQQNVMNNSLLSLFRDRVRSQDYYSKHFVVNIIDHNNNMSNNSGDKMFHQVFEVRQIGDEQVSLALDILHLNWESDYSDPNIKSLSQNDNDMLMEFYLVAQCSVMHDMVLSHPNIATYCDSWIQLPSEYYEEYDYNGMKSLLTFGAETLLETGDCLLTAEMKDWLSSSQGKLIHNQ